MSGINKASAISLFFYSLFFPSLLSLNPGHLKEPEHPSMWGPVELVGIIAGPVFLLFLIIIIVFLVINYHQRVYHNRQRLDMEDPSCEMCLSKDKTLQDLVYDLSTSGSGSGTEFFRPCVCCWPSLLVPSRIECLRKGLGFALVSSSTESFGFILPLLLVSDSNKIR